MFLKLATRPPNSIFYNMGPCTTSNPPEFCARFYAIVHFIIISEFLKFIVLLFYLFCSVGDPFKDTAGPSLHVLIKMLATITLVMAPIFLWELFVPINSCSITPFEISAAFGTHFPWILRYFAQLGISMYIIMGAWFIGILILSWSE